MILRRKYLDKINDYIDSPMIKVIKGIRRSGKIEILKMIIEEIKTRGIEEEQVIYINFESIFGRRQFDRCELIFQAIFT